MNAKGPKDESFEVLDSTDWLATPLPKLSAVEAALRCQVCKDFYTSPMITSCSHTFCSLCIRRALSENGLCPGCRTPDQELRLRFNNTVYDMVEAFKAARPEVLEYTKERPILEVRSASPKRRREVSGLDGAEEGPSAKRTRSSRRVAQATERIEILDSDADDEDFIPEKGFVQCPVCQKVMKEASINAHLDRNCMDEPQARKPERTRPIPNQLPQTEVKRPERLAQLNYSMVKDGPLKKKLMDQGLSAAGSRQMLERRYSEWITLWNSNCDARLPKGKNELRRELDVWERTQGGRAQASGLMNSGAQIREKDFDGQAWATKHDDSFRDLIAAARRKLPPKTAAPPEPAPEPAAPTSPGPEYISTHATLLDPSNPETTNIGAMTHDQLPVLSQPVSTIPQASLEGPDGAQRRFFDEGTTGSADIPTSSQYSHEIPVLEKDAGIASDITTMETVQS